MKRERERERGRERERERERARAREMSKRLIFNCGPAFMGDSKLKTFGGNSTIAPEGL